MAFTYGISVFGCFWQTSVKYDFVVYDKYLAFSTSASLSLKEKLFLLLIFTVINGAYTCPSACSCNFWKMSQTNRYMNVTYFTSLSHMNTHRYAYVQHTPCFRKSLGLSIHDTHLVLLIYSLKCAPKVFDQTT